MEEGNVWNECSQSRCCNKEKETGITIHYVNEDYDEGGCISKKSNLSGSETPEDIAERIHELEQSYLR
jgi:phosphoribosylglycinamide formyltransferase-1